MYFRTQIMREMPKYRVLNPEELRDFEKQFVDYLIINGLDADSWESLKSSDSERANRLIEIFSDMIFEKILRNSQYLVYVNNTAVYSFHFKDDHAELNIAEFPAHSLAIDNEKVLIDFLENNIDAENIKLQKKSYHREREEEMFELLSSGCRFSEGQVHEWLNHASEMMAG